VLGHPKRLELIDLLAQAPRSVEDLAAAADLRMSICSAHLQTLREAGLLETRRDGKRIYHSLTGDDVANLSDRLRRVAQHHRPHTEMASRAYLGLEDSEAIDTEELLRRLESGDTLILDVRPDPRVCRRSPTWSRPHSARAAGSPFSRASTRQRDRRLLPR
jgi:DNA-binding transcriptional ArsR family regulator